MFEYLAAQDLPDPDEGSGMAPLIVFPVNKIPPPVQIFDPMVTGSSSMDGCWRLAHWDSHENVGVYQLDKKARVTMAFEEASEYLAYDW